MGRRFVWIVAALGMLALGAATFWLMRPRPPAPRPTPAVTRVPSRPAPPASAAPSAVPERRAPARRATPPRPQPEAPAAPPALRIEADVPDASVFLDRRFLGKAPVDVRDVAPGNHRVNVSADGYEMQAEDVVIGEQPVVVSARFKEVRLDESLEVVHKHGFGSCRGRLRATTAGIAFKAADGKDSFEAPRGSVQLSVDYLKKNLRVAVSGGRTYNFTVDAPNADPLLVFQQKASAAWARLP